MICSSAVIAAMIRSGGGGGGVVTCGGDNKWRPLDETPGRLMLGFRAGFLGVSVITGDDIGAAASAIQTFP